MRYKTPSDLVRYLIENVLCEKCVSDLLSAMNGKFNWLAYKTFMHYLCPMCDDKLMAQKLTYNDIMKEQVEEDNKLLKTSYDYQTIKATFNQAWQDLPTEDDVMFISEEQEVETD
jgi:hypothetical protein